MSWHELTPAYDHVYTTQKQVHDAWHVHGHDFLLHQGGRSTYINKQDADRAGGMQFTVRYGKQHEKVMALP